MEFIGDIGRKTGDPRILAIEAEKSRRGAQIGLDSGLFRVPAVLSFDKNAGVLEFERVSNLITFFDMVNHALPAQNEMAKRAGQALARIHQQLILDDSMKIPLPSKWAGIDGKNVFIHGDFTANNVCINKDNMELIIIDWSAAPIVGRSATIGSGVYDVVSFIRHLIMCAPWSKTLTWPGNSLCDSFVLGYVQESGEPINRMSWLHYRSKMINFAKNTINERIQNTPLLTKPAKAICQFALYQAWCHYTPPPGATYMKNDFN